MRGWVPPEGVRDLGDLDATSGIQTVTVADSAASPDGSRGAVPGSCGAPGSTLPDTCFPILTLVTSPRIQYLTIPVSNPGVGEKKLRVGRTAAPISSKR